MTNLQWVRAASNVVPILQWLRAESTGTAQTAPVLQWIRAESTGTAPSAPRLQWIRAASTGTAALALAPIPDRTVEPGSLVELEAVIAAGSPGVFAWRVVSVSPAGTPVGLVVDGETCVFTAPSAVNGQRAPVQVAVVVGVTNTVDGITSPERTTTVTVLPQLAWVYNGSAFVGRPHAYVGA